MQIVSRDSKNKKARPSEPEEKKDHTKYHKWMRKTIEKLTSKENGVTYGQLGGLTSDWGNQHETARKLKRRYQECENADIPFAPLWWYKYNNEN